MKQFSEQPLSISDEYEQWAIVSSDSLSFTPDLAVSPSFILPGSYSHHELRLAPNHYTSYVTICNEKYTGVVVLVVTPTYFSLVDSYLTHLI